MSRFLCLKTLTLSSLTAILHSGLLFPRTPSVALVFGPIIRAPELFERVDYVNKALDSVVVSSTVSGLVFCGPLVGGVAPKEFETAAIF